MHKYTLPQLLRIFTVPAKQRQIPSCPVVPRVAFRTRALQIGLMMSLGQLEGLRQRKHHPNYPRPTTPRHDVEKS